MGLTQRRIGVLRRVVAGHFCCPAGVVEPSAEGCWPASMVSCWVAFHPIPGFDSAHVCRRCRRLALAPSPSRISISFVSHFRIDKFSPCNPDWLSHCAFGGSPDRAVTLPASSGIFPSPDDSTSIARPCPAPGLKESWLNSKRVAASQVESRSTLTRIVQTDTHTAWRGAG
jgi:hypothetical protein